MVLRAAPAHADDPPHRHRPVRAPGVHLGRPRHRARGLRPVRADVLLLPVPPVNRIAHEGLVKKAIGGHWGLAPNLGKLAIENKIEAYNLPQRVISQMFRNMATNKPAIISKVGIGTFVDPDLEGGKVNTITKEDIVNKINVFGEEVLFYKCPKLDYAILRGTSSDEDGNISFENEALLLEGIHIASATKNAGGKVIVQVEKVVKRGSISPKEVKIPGILVDYVVVVLRI